MAKNKIATLIFFSLFFSFFLKANNNYIVYFKDKNQAIDIKKLFSEKAIAKRIKFNIPFDERDFPVNEFYKNEIQKNGISILSTSNWLNSILINANENSIQLVAQLPFVTSIQKIEKSSFQQKNIASVTKNNACEEMEDFENNFASSYAQFHLLNGDYLHELGFNGENMTIAICDNGFYNANNNEVFNSIFSENRILGTYDYVNGDSAVYDEAAGSHGAYCFSFIGATKSNQYIGTSTKSNFYLFHTENNNSERLQEEFNLAVALQRCSELGVDVVSISLGYTTFDDASENHDTTDMRLNSTPAAKAVNIAASKNILVCVAAGNEGAGAWHYITSPADADSAFAIAAVDANGNVATFSSYGLANDIRIKPNVAAVGRAANFINTYGAISTGNGTSFACPSLAGMATCLWQAFPSKTAWQIKTAIEQSASQYLTPDKHIGYGIPDFKKAYQTLAAPNTIDDKIAIYPNPFQTEISINHNNITNIQSIQIYNNIGQLVYSNTNFSASEKSIYLNNLTAGMFIFKITTTNGDIFTKKIIKE